GSGPVFPCRWNLSTNFGIIREMRFQGIAMAKKIAILEDNEERKAAMLHCLEDKFYQFEKRFFDGPAEMLEFLKLYLPETIAISLDHDLELIPSPGGKMFDPGSGREVADFLAQQLPTCPVIIHTSNSSAAAGMEMVLQ